MWKRKHVQKTYRSHATAKAPQTVLSFLLALAISCIQALPASSQLQVVARTIEVPRTFAEIAHVLGSGALVSWESVLGKADRLMPK